MNRRNSTVWIIGYITLGIGLFATLIWGNYRYTRENPGGNDFLVHWVGTQAFLQDGISPYSDEVALRIQTMVYGRAAQPGEHELRVAYPLYSILLFIPFALIQEYELARAVWMALLEAGLIAMAFMTLSLVRWRPKPVMLGLFLLFSVFWYHALRPIILGNAVILIALGIVGALLALRSGRDELAGVLLGLATIKPQVMVVFLVFITFWSFKERRFRVLAWLGITLGLLVGFAFLLIPDWLLQNIREILRYPEYNPPGTLQTALGALIPGAGQRVGLVVSILVVVVMVFEWLLIKRKEFRAFLWTACLTLVVSFWAGLQTDPGNFILAYPALALVISVLSERWRGGGALISIVFMAVLFIGIWAIFLATVEQSYQPIQSPIMFLPLPILLLFGLYWIRWWAIRPPNVWFDTLE